MSLLTMASYNSLNRGYDYYDRNMVVSCKEINQSEYEGIVKGSNNEHYQVNINLIHPKKSFCDCKHAEGNSKVCKHKVALYYAAFPDEAMKVKKYIEEQERLEEKSRQREMELNSKIHKYISGLSKEELKNILLELIYDSGDRVFNRFLREHIFEEVYYEDYYEED